MLNRVARYLLSSNFIEIALVQLGEHGVSLVVSARKQEAREVEPAMSRTSVAPDGLSSSQTILLALLVGFSLGTVGLLALAYNGMAVPSAVRCRSFWQARYFSQKHIAPRRFSDSFVLNDRLSYLSARSRVGSWPNARRPYR